MMKIYTRKGDDGTTALFGGQRLGKDDIRIEAYGTIDELNSFLGLLADGMKGLAQRQHLLDIQHTLFDLGSTLATAPGTTAPIRLDALAEATKIEGWIDELAAELAPLRDFILPGGDELVSLAHICRTICRRAERRVISLSHGADIPSGVLIYLNRLSDYFFMLARHIAQERGVEEVRWTSKG